MQHSSSAGRSGMLCAAAIIAFLSLLTVAAAGDTLKLKNGQVYEGKLISRTASKIVFRIERSGISQVKEFRAAEVESVIESAPDAAGTGESPSAAAGSSTAGPAGGAAGKEPIPIERRDGKGKPYYVLPIRGVFGIEVTAPIVAECLAAARQLRAEILVLDIESPGGMVEELKAVLGLLDQCGDLRVIAYVRDAKSAAAILAMGCKEIVMAERAQIGACTPYETAPDGTPKNIAAKFESALRADFRAVAERNGYNPLLVEGMMRDDIELGIRVTANGYRVVEGGGDQPLKRRGEILTLTTKQAQTCGLAKGVAKNLDAIGKALDLGECFDVSDHGRLRTSAWSDEIHAVMEKLNTVRKNAVSGLTDAEAYARAGRRTETTDSLRRAESNLRALEELAKKYPSLADSDSINQLRTRIRAIRKSIEGR